MNWKLQEHKLGNGQQELQVRILVKEMLNWDCLDSESFIRRFKDELPNIKRTNSFSAENMFKATPRNWYSLEIWKLKADGEYNYKMFTLTKKT